MNHHPFQRRDLRPDISIVDSSVPVTVATPSASALVLRDSSPSTTTTTTTYRKLRRFNGDVRARMGSNGSLRHCSISTGAVAAALCLLIAHHLWLPVAEAAAYLTEQRNSKLPVTPHRMPSSPSNQRYAFLTRPKDKFFTSTGILPALAPSEDLTKILPPLPIAGPPTSNNEQEDIRVTYTNDPQTVDRWLCKNLPYDGCFLGFDIERVPESRSRHMDKRERSLFAHVAVVQLATTNACLVVQLVDTSSLSITDDDDHHHPKHNHNPCARILRSVLEDPSIVKVGCSIDEDLVLLHEVWGGKTTTTTTTTTTTRQTTRKSGSKNDPHPHHPANPRVAVVKTNGNHRHQSYSHGSGLQARSRFDLGCVILPKTDPDLRYTPFLFDVDHGRRNHKYTVTAKNTTTLHNKSGLQGLCKAILRVDLPKERENCASDWTRFPLADDQITYAARDAWAGAAIATKLASMEVESSPGTNGNVFSRCNLIQVLKGAETPLPQLAQRHRQRKEAKSELDSILHPHSKLLLRNTQNFRRLHQPQPRAKPQPILVPGNSTCVYNNNSDVDALFPTYPVTSRRTFRKHAQNQQLMMEKSLPIEVRERTMELRQMINAKVIDHRVVFEIDPVPPGGKIAEREDNLELEPKNEESQQQQQHCKGRRRRRNRKNNNPNNVSTPSHR